MKLKFLFIIFIQFCNFYLNAQVWQPPKINIGFGLRGNLNTIVDGTERRVLYVNQGLIFRLPDLEEESTSERFLLDFVEKIPGNNNLYLSLSNYISLRKYKAFKKVITDLTNPYTERTKRDHFIDIINQFKTKKKWLKIDAGFGFGLINCGTNFFIKPVSIFPQPTSVTYGNDRSFAIRLQTGVNLERLKLLFVLHNLSRENFGLPKIWMEGKIAFIINPFSVVD